ncbi:MAG: ribosome maturation factor RimP [Pseudomonadota bacterium]
MSEETTADRSSADERLITENGLEARIAGIVEPLLRSMDFRLVRVRLSGHNGLTLQVMAERNDGTMTVEDCELVSRALSPVLDVEDPIDRAYHLEISSAGIDRPMVRRSDFTRWSGHLVKCETSWPVAESKRFRGMITDVGADGFTLRRDEAGDADDAIVEIPFAALSEAKLILTDDLIRDALAADKAAKAARTKNAGTNRPNEQET